VPTALAPDPLTITVGATGTLTATLAPTPSVGDPDGNQLSTDGGDGARLGGLYCRPETVSVPVTAVNPGTR
jgi:hypothetical protein